ncbi:alpha-1,4-N-acetylglucosaminyltransferase-like [Pelodytes ibericus]
MADLKAKEAAMQPIATKAIMLPADLDLPKEPIYTEEDKKIAAKQYAVFKEGKMKRLFKDPGQQKAATGLQLLFKRDNMNNKLLLHIINIQSSFHNVYSFIRDYTGFNALSQKDILSHGNAVIFMETGNRTKPPPLVLCAIESAARVYHDRPVVFFMKGLAETDTDDDVTKTRMRFPTLSSFQNVYIFPLNMEEVLKDTPLLSWYQMINLKKEPYWLNNFSNGCRLALIWNHGGVYMDTDVISIQPIPDINFVGAQSSQMFNNAVFGLSPHHNFTWNCMANFVKNYKGKVWGNQGPRLFTRVLKKSCDLPTFKTRKDFVCGDISLLHPQRYYPISWVAWKKYYQVWNTFPTFNESYGLHLWNKMNRGHKTVAHGNKTLVDHLYEQYCPTTYRTVVRNESIHL